MKEPRRLSKRRRSSQGRGPPSSKKPRSSIAKAAPTVSLSPGPSDKFEAPAKVEEDIVHAELQPAPSLSSYTPALPATACEFSHSTLEIDHHSMTSPVASTSILSQRNQDVHPDQQHALHPRTNTNANDQHTPLRQPSPPRAVPATRAPTSSPEKFTRTSDPRKGSTFTSIYQGQPALSPPPPMRPISDTSTVSESAPRTTNPVFYTSPKAVSSGLFIANPLTAVHLSDNDKVSQERQKPAPLDLGNLIPSR